MMHRSRVICHSGIGDYQDYWFLLHNHSVLRFLDTVVLHRTGTTFKLLFIALELRGALQSLLLVAPNPHVKKYTHT